MRIGFHRSFIAWRIIPNKIPNKTLASIFRGGRNHDPATVAFMLAALMLNAGQGWANGSESA
jgi:hypothetical protein